MPKEKSSRKWQITINNPPSHGLSHERIKLNINELKSISYWCLSDEIGEEGTYHTHVFLYSKNPIMFNTLKKRFQAAHIEMCKGSCQENKDYILKEGKYLDSEKKTTNLKDTFEEYGEFLSERNEQIKQSEKILEMIKNGASDFEIINTYPSAMKSLQHIDKARQTVQIEKYKTMFRKLDVHYIYGSTGIGKTRYVMEKYGYENVYRVTNYTNPFDNYNSEDVMLFDEFHSQIQITDMLIYLDGYPFQLPCRYNDKVACYTKVYIISNIDLFKQYEPIQIYDFETWNAFIRRLNTISEINCEGKHIDLDKEKYILRKDCYVK